MLDVHKQYITFIFVFHFRPQLKKTQLKSSLEYS